MKPEMSIEIEDEIKFVALKEAIARPRKCLLLDYILFFYNSSFKDDIDHTNRNTRYDTIVCLQGLDKNSEIGFLSPV